jgi:hypothetical protein
MLATPKQRARAIRLGIPITVQHPLVYTMGAEMVAKWGPERAARAMPIGAWLKEGGRLSAGSDYPAAGGDAMVALWGMATRGTRKSGVLGAEYEFGPYGKGGNELTACGLSDQAFLRCP